MGKIREFFKNIGETFKVMLSNDEVTILDDVKADNETKKILKVLDTCSAENLASEFDKRNKVDQTFISKVRGISENSKKENNSKSRKDKEDREIE